jgi:hypothetical protein
MVLRILGAGADLSLNSRPYSASSAAKSVEEWALYCNHTDCLRVIEEFLAAHGHCDKSKRAKNNDGEILTGFSHSIQALGDPALTELRRLVPISHIKTPSTTTRSHLVRQVFSLVFTPEQVADTRYTNSGNSNNPRDNTLASVIFQGDDGQGVIQGSGESQSNFSAMDTS